MQLHRTGAHTTSDIAELFGVACSTVYRAIHRAGDLGAFFLLWRVGDVRLRVSGLDGHGRT